MLYIKIESTEHDNIYVCTPNGAIEVLEGMAEDGLDMEDCVKVTEVYEMFETRYTGLEYLCYTV